MASENTKGIEIILREYLRSRPRADNGIKSFKDAQLYAEEIGDIMAGAIADNCNFEMCDEAAAVEILEPLLRQAYKDAARAGSIAQQTQNRRAQLGLGTLEAEFDASVVPKIAEKVAYRPVLREDLSNLLTQRTLGAVDETIRVNVRAREEMGLKVHIVRRYDNVGLRSGTKHAEDCQWCLERCGEWDDYQEAYDAGCFERHPGCGCMIEYHVGKTHTWQNSAGGWNAY